MLLVFAEPPRELSTSTASTSSGTFDLTPTSSPLYWLVIGMWMNYNYYSVRKLPLHALLLFKQNLLLAPRALQAMQDWIGRAMHNKVKAKIFSFAVFMKTALRNPSSSCSVRRRWIPVRFLTIKATYTMIWYNRFMQALKIPLFTFSNLCFSKHGGNSQAFEILFPGIQKVVFPGGRKYLENWPLLLSVR